MAGVRIRWRGVARAAAIILVGLLALRLVPSLLHAPEPPPLGRDVGLPKAKPETLVQPVRHRHPRHHKLRKDPSPRPKPKPKPHEPTPAKVDSTPPPAPEHVPPPAYEPVPEPAPEPPPEPPPAPESVPGDGSEEFAPH